MQVNYFYPLTFGMTVPLHRKILLGERSSFSTKFDLLSFISSKSEIKEHHSNPSKVDNLNLHRKRSIDQKFATNSPIYQILTNDHVTCHVVRITC